MNETMRSARGRLATVGLAFALLAALSIGAWCWFGRANSPGPPEISLAGADPAVAAVVEAARAGVRRAPNSAAAWGGMGEVLMANQFPLDADACFARAETLDPAEPRWPYLRAWGVLPRDRDAGLLALQHAVERCERTGGDDVAPLLLLAEVYMEQDDRNQAEALCRRVLELRPDNGRAHLDLGMIALTHNDLENSIPHLLRAAESPFARQRASIQLATAFERRGEATAAEEYTRRAREAPPDPPDADPFLDEMQDMKVGREARYQRVNRLASQGRLPEAGALLRDMSNEYADERSYVQLGVVLTKLEDFAGAERALRSAAAVAPSSIDAYYYLTVALYNEGELLQKAGDAAAVAKFQAAAEAGRKATELKPDHGLAYLYLGYALERLGRMAEAIGSFRTALRCRPELAEVELALGEALAKDGRRDEALAHLQRANDIAEPNDPRPREALVKARGDQIP